MTLSSSEGFFAFLSAGLLVDLTGFLAIHILKKKKQNSIDKR
jgi:hypothetical protein